MLHIYYPLQSLFLDSLADKEEINEQKGKKISESEHEAKILNKVYGFLAIFLSNSHSKHHFVLFLMASHILHLDLDELLGSFKRNPFILDPLQFLHFLMGINIDSVVNIDIIGVHFVANFMKKGLLLRRMTEPA